MERDGNKTPAERKRFDEGELARELHGVALEGGFAAFGIATPESLAGVPAHADPESVLPGYRAVLVLGAPSPRYTSLGPKSPVLLDAGPSDALVNIRDLVVAAGYRVAPAGGSSISFPMTAVAAGIGTLAPNGMVVANRYGLGLQLFVLVTDAPLPGTPFPGESGDRTMCRACRRCLEDCSAVEGEEFRRDWCAGCRRCLAACPLDASAPG